MRQRYIWLIIAGAVAMLMLGCGGLAVASYFVAQDFASTALGSAETIEREGQRFELPSPAATASAAPTGVPSAAASPAAPATTTPSQTPPQAAATAPSLDTIVYKDTFADDGSGWYTVAETGVSIEYADGGYHFVLSEPETGYWETHRSIRLQRLADVSIEVEARQVDGYVDDAFGIVCRASEDGYYALEIGADGWYSIGKMNGDEYTLLVGPDGGPGDKPFTTDTHDIALQRQDDDGYHLRADCIGDTLTLYVDGEKIAEVQDDTFSMGGIGLAAYNYQAPRTEIVFDNIVVRAP